MTQFASTLYPQTNPTNPILLEFRSRLRGAKEWHAPVATDSQWEHARQVLRRRRNFLRSITSG